MATKEVKEAQTKLQETYTYVVYPKQLIELGEKLSGKGLKDKAIEISEKANIKIKDPQLEQVYLHASKSLAYQYLKNWKSAEDSINQSMNFLRGWEYNNKEIGKLESNSEFLQTKILALTVQGNFYKFRNKTQLATNVYQEAFDLLQLNSNKLNNFNKNTQIITATTVESMHRGLIELFSIESSQRMFEKLSKVRESLKEHYIAELDKLLENKKWEAANQLTSKLILYLGGIARGEQLDYLSSEDILNLNCDDLGKIDDSWFNHSDGRFGFRVQKQIWLDTGNKKEYNYEAIKKFFTRVEWVSNEGSIVSYDMVIRRIDEDYKKAPEGSLPYLSAQENTYLTFGEGWRRRYLRLVNCNI